ncbi:hypothetical protein LS482_13105 [Sinomicrobium kalidii]|uniref:hypothetical protein n=1 Tax=Sinomicrobium kalidii TaxID=2900738 RepID=UPI001E63D9C5|nr:hypothetical protein [Sinomicrobium kalidii]UGU14635.1 hypothetical protein LS482_13105 [Sinomicrobium kalidii]
MIHNFHIPVMGLAYTIDTPLRVASYGIDSVISIVDDELAEKMRVFFCEKYSLPYTPIPTKIQDYRARRITGYLDLMDKLVKEKFKKFSEELSMNRHELEKFVAMLPKTSVIKKKLEDLSSDRFFGRAGKVIRDYLSPGAIDVNIMTKVDKTNYRGKTALPSLYNDAHAALRGFANSTLNSSLVLSAGMNPSLYSYMGTFKDFFPDGEGVLKKKIVLKVSDFRSAMIQGRFLAKKGIWVSEYRVESGLNCGGHAFATDGLLLGPIMEEFAERRQELAKTAHELLVKALEDKGIRAPESPMDIRITVQGGVGTSEEHEFLLQHYKADSVGWGSPFLLVPEATATDKATRELLAKTGENELYRSDLSPLGVPFNTVAGTTNDYFKEQRIKTGRAGSSCPKKLLALNREFGEKGICTASRKYQEVKLEEAEEEKGNLTVEALGRRRQAITVKACLCVGLANPVYLEKNMKIKGEQQGVVICPGPNMAYFDKEIPLREMVRHIYGYTSVLAERDRPHFFIKELQLYLDYLVEEIREERNTAGKAKIKRWNTFKNNLLSGIAYYENLFAGTSFFGKDRKNIKTRLADFKACVAEIDIPEA